MYKVKAPAGADAVSARGKTWKVRNGMITAEDYQEAQFLIAEAGCTDPANPPKAVPAPKGMTIPRPAVQQPRPAA